LVAAVASYLDARAAGGEWLVRIENLDPPREVPGAADDILACLEAFGFEWDGEIRYQGQRFPQYLEQIDHLMAKGHAYPCCCSRKIIAATAPMGIEGPIYPGTCRQGMADTDSNTQSIRLRTHDEPILFQDLIQGPCQQRVASEIGDFVIRRVEGYPAYQLAVVMDDAEQGISRIVRGYDLFHSTARQIHLQRLLGYPQPTYAHLPLVLDE
jgi:glutamyl-Q tRNA(Asp) synthetase